MDQQTTKEDNDRKSIKFTEDSDKPNDITTEVINAYDNANNDCKSKNSCDLKVDNGSNLLEFESNQTAKKAINADYIGLEKSDLSDAEGITKTKIFDVCGDSKNNVACTSKAFEKLVKVNAKIPDEDAEQAKHRKLDSNPKIAEVIDKYNDFMLNIMHQDGITFGHLSELKETIFDERDRLFKELNLFGKESENTDGTAKEVTNADNDNIWKQIFEKYDMTIESPKKDQDAGTSDA